MKRRTLVQFAATAASSILMNQISAGCSRLNNAETITNDFIWRMPDESEPHERTWMAFGAARKIWGHKLFPEVQDTLVTIAKSIAEYEPVYMLVREADYDLAKQNFGSSLDLFSSQVTRERLRVSTSILMAGARSKHIAMMLKLLILLLNKLAARQLRPSWY